MSDSDNPILVSGAAGYLASWVAELLLREGRRVHATVRRLDDGEKTGHLQAMAARHPGRLRLFEADLLEEGSFDEAMAGCAAAIHTASPYFLEPPKDFEGQLLKPARQGTLNLIGAVNRSPSLKRLVVTSSVAALYGDARDLAGAPSHRVSEGDINPNTDTRHNPYAYAKTAAEQAAWEAQKAQSRWDMVTIHPGAIFGPSLSKRRDGTSVGMMLQFLDGSFCGGVPRLWLGVVDVRDAAAAHVRAALLPQAKGRYIVVGESLSLLQIARAMRPLDQGIADKLPKGEVPKSLIWLIAPLVGMSRKYVARNVGYPLAFDHRRSLSDLGLNYRPPAETFGDHIRQIATDGLLPSKSR